MPSLINTLAALLLLVLPLVNLYKLSTTTVPDCTPKCENGWSFYNGYCYGLNTSALSQSEAQAACKSVGANLVSIHDEKENKFVKDLLKKWFIGSHGNGLCFWMGLMLDYDICNINSKKPIGASYTDGTKVDYGNPVTTKPGDAPWSDGAWWNNGVPFPEPNNIYGQENCVHMPQNEKANGEWSDVGCSARLGFMCKKKWKY